MRRFFPFGIVALLWLAGLGHDRFREWVASTDLPPLGIAQSVEVLDREGTLLRAFTVEDGRWRLATDLDQVDPTYIALLLRYEDKRFYAHRGVDPVAVLRAIGQSIRSGHVVSGGSTLTMQVARLIENSGTGSWSGKIRQIRVALALEQRLTKDEILLLYLNRAPFGGNIEGLRSATYAYFGKPPRRLTLAESALLVALPQSPETRRPDRNHDAAVAARDRVLDRIAGAGLAAQDAVAAAKSESIPAQRQDFPAIAAHLADRARLSDPIADRHLTTLSAPLQIALEQLAEQSVASRSDRLQVAIVVADHQTGEILASVGSAGYRPDERGGFVDLTQAARSPGSTLKPLVYGLAFDQGMVHPETLISDRPTDFDGYRPQNFDGSFRGDIRVREALQLSLNIPVVSLLQAMGPQHLVTGMHRAGVAPQIPGGRPGLAVALGGLGISREDLVQLYAAIADSGRAVDLHWQIDQSDTLGGQQVMGDVAAWEIADILLHTPRPAGVVGQGIAYKTGTSYGNRDAWSVGFDGRHVIGVWMGRADGTSVPGAFGGELAAPVMFRAFQRLGVPVTPIRPPPAATLLLPNAQLPIPLRRFRPAGDLGEIAALRLAFPPDGAVIDGPLLVARVEEGVAPFTWLLNGAPFETTVARQIELPDLGRGYSTVTVLDGNGQSARATVEIRP